MAPKSPNQNPRKPIATTVAPPDTDCVYCGSHSFVVFIATQRTITVGGSELTGDPTWAKAICKGCGSLVEKVYVGGELVGLQWQASLAPLTQQAPSDHNDQSTVGRVQ